MALSKILENSITDGVVSSAKLKDFSAAVDLNGVELILDADQDTSITADTDDRIDFKIANVEHFSFSNSSGDTVVKPMVDAKDIIFQQYDGNKILEINDGNYVGIGGNAAGAGEIRIYEDTDNGTHYTGFKAGNNTASVAYVLPTADGSSGQGLTTDGSGTLSWSTLSANTPTSADGQALGSASLEWSDLYLADSSVIYFGADQDVTLTHNPDTGLTLNTVFAAASLDISGNIDVDGTTNLDAVDIDGAVQLDATLTVGANDQGYDVILYGDTASANVTWDTSADDLIFNGAAGLIVPDGQLTLGSTAVTSTAAELNLLDGVSGLVQADLTKLAAVDSTAAELNIVDGGTSATSTTVADADRVVMNDNGTMVQVAVTDLAAYFDDEITSMPNLTTAAALVTVSALNSGSIATGFGNIDNGASNITSGGLVKLDVDADADDVSGDSATGRLTLGAGEDLNLYHGGTNSYIVNDTGDLILKTGASDEDMIFQGNDGGSAITALTLDMSAAGAAAFNSTVTATGFIIGSANINETELEIIDGATITTTELNIIDGDTSATGTTVADADRVVMNDNGTMVQVAVTDLAAYFDDEITAMPNLTSVGTLTALTVDDVAIDGKVMTMTGSSSDTFVVTVGTNGATSLVTTDAAAAAANLQITADGTVDIDGTTITLDSAGDIILDAAGNDIEFHAAGTKFASIELNSTEVYFEAHGSDHDVKIRGNDGGSTINMLSFDTSAAGQAVFNSTVTAKTDTDTSNTGNVTLDFAANQNFVLTLTGNTTLVNPSTETVGQSGFIACIQDGTGSRTLSLGTDYETAAGAGITLSTAASATDLIPYVVVAANRILLGQPQKSFS